MVSFNCNRCGDVVKKPKVQSHAAQCGTPGYSCVDCMQQFDLRTIDAHRQCVSETDKYQGKWQDKKKTIRATAEGAADDTDVRGSRGDLLLWPRLRANLDTRTHCCLESRRHAPPAA